MPADDTLEQATRACGEMVRNMGGKLMNGREWRMKVTDERALPLFVIRLSAERLKD